MNDENLWGEEEVFNDQPDEVSIDSNGNQREAAPVQVQRTAPTQEQLKARADARAAWREEAAKENVEVEQESADTIEEDEDFSDALSDASLRLEQGNLYKMILNQDIFDGVDADARAVKIVQKQIRNFAKEKMEEMLGMRQETSTVEHLEIDFPFNQKEVEVLKALAHTATKGDSENSDRFVPQVTRTTEEVPTVGEKKLRPIKTTSAPKKLAQPQPQAKKQLPTKPTAPIKRTKLDADIDRIAAEEGIPRELLEENYVPLNVPASQLSEQELLNRNRQLAKRTRTQVRSANALPMATPEQMELLAASRVMQINQSPGMSKLLEAVSKLPIKNK